MATQTVPSPQERSQLPRPIPRQLVRATLWSAAGLLVGLAGLLLLRRLDGALRQPLSAGALLGVGVLLAAVSASLRCLWRRLPAHRPASSPAHDLLFETLPTVGTAMLGAAISLRGSPPWGLLVFWLLVSATEIASWVTRRGGLRGLRLATGRVFQSSVSRGASAAWGGRSEPAPRNETAPESAGGGPGAGTEPGPWADAEWEHREDGEASEDWLPPGVLQRITRAETEQRAAVVHGLVRCDLAPGQRQQNIHLAFCPPLRHRPQVHAEAANGPKATVTVTFVETFGACLEVKLAAATATAASVQVQFFATEETAE